MKKFLLFILSLSIISPLCYARKRFPVPRESGRGYYPIGFSKRGLFAYGYFDGFSQVPSTGVIVQNMINDKIIIRLTHELYSSENDKIKDFKSFWKINYSKIINKLRPYRIRFFTKIPFYSISHLKSKYGIRIMVKNHHIYAVSRRGKRKRIFKGSSSPFGIKTSILGYYKSPYEKRVLILVEFTPLAGPSINESSEELIGCHLTKRLR